MSDSRLRGSVLSLGRFSSRIVFGQVVHTRVPLSLNSTIRHRPKSDDTLRLER